MAEWHEVVNAYAANEPSRPFSVRGMTAAQKQVLVARELGLGPEGQTRFILDFEGRSFRASWGLVTKLAQYANHAAYSGWIEQSVKAPLEVWEHTNPRSTDVRPRRYYFAAYIGPSGATTHLVIAAFGNVLLNGFRIENASTADNDRFGKLLYVGYNPIYSPLPMAKGAPFPVAPLPI
jgi:hypothetical protein